MVRQRSDRKAGATFLVPAHHPVSGGEPVGTAPGETDRLHPVDHRRRVEQVGLASARASATHVARCHRPAVDAHHGGSGAPTAPTSLVVPDEDAGHVGDVAEAHPVLGGGQLGLGGGLDGATADRAPHADADDVQRTGDQQRRADGRLAAR